MLYNKEKGIAISVPIFLIVAIIPLIVRIKIVDFSNIGRWYLNDVDADFFSYYKMIATILLMVVGFIIFLVAYFTKGDIKITKTGLYKPLFVYLFFAWLSFLLSDNKVISKIGAQGRYEGIYTLTAYILIVVLAINTVRTEEQIKLVLYGLVASATIIAIIGVFQYNGKDFFSTEFGKKIILGETYERLKDSVTIKFGYSWIYSTLNNPNYVGSYMVMIIPVSLVLLKLSKNKLMRVLFGSLTVLFTVNIFGSNSRAGIVGMVTSMSVAAILFFIKNRISTEKNSKSKLKRFGTISATIVILITIIGIASNGALLKPIKRITNELSKSNTQQYLKNVEKDGNDIIFTTKDSTLRISRDKGNLLFYDEDGKSIEFKNNSEEITFTDERYKNYKLTIQQIDGIEDSYRGDLYDSNIEQTYYLAITPEDIFIATKAMQDINLINPKIIGFNGYEKIGSNRGYIWSRSIPLMVSNPLVGIGPDSYVLEFPQGDIVGKVNNYNNPYMVVDKPHNMYLQIGINTGIISLISLLVLFAVYIVQSIKLFLNNEKSTVYTISFGLFIAILGYLVAGMFNDSVISVAPVFWVLLGSGISINLAMKKDMVKKEIDN